MSEMRGLPRETVATSEMRTTDVLTSVRFFNTTYTAVDTTIRKSEDTGAALVMALDRVHIVTTDDAKRDRQSRARCL